MTQAPPAPASRPHAGAVPAPTPAPAPTPDPVTLTYGLLPASRRGRLICAATFAVLLLVAIAIVGRGPTGAVDVEGTTVTFLRPGPDGALPVDPGLGDWAYEGAAWSVDGGAAGEVTGAGVGYAVLTRPPGASVQTTIDVLADGAGLVFRYEDPANHWGIRAVPSYGGWNIFKVVDGRESIERVLVGQALDGTKVGVQQSGRRFRIMLNGLVRSTIDDPALAQATGVGLMAPAGDDTARFRALTVGSFDGTIAMRSGDDEQDEIVPSLNPGGT